MYENVTFFYEIHVPPQSSQHRKNYDAFRGRIKDSCDYGETGVVQEFGR